MRYTTEDKIQMLRMYQAGASIRQISKHYKACRTTVAIAVGPENMRPKGGVKKYDRKKLAAIIAKPLSVKEIAAEVGCSADFIYTILRQR